MSPPSPAPLPHLPHTGQFLNQNAIVSVRTTTSANAFHLYIMQTLKMSTRNWVRRNSFIIRTWLDVDHKARTTFTAWRQRAFWLVKATVLCFRSYGVTCNHTPALSQTTTKNCRSNRILLLFLGCYRTCGTAAAKTHPTAACIMQVHYGNRWTDNRRKCSDPNSGESMDVFFPVSPEIFAAANPRQRRIIGCHAGGPFG